MSKPKKKTQTALNSFLVAADALAKTNQLVEAELRYKDALKSAEKLYGEYSDQAMLVTSILAAFYRAQDRFQEALELENRLQTWPMDGGADTTDDTGSKFLKGMKADGDQQLSGTALRIPANLRRACQVLGLSVDVPISPQDVNKAWKAQMLSKSAHPDLGGNTDEAVILNKAKEELMNFFAEREPKLGKSLKNK